MPSSDYRKLNVDDFDPVRFEEHHEVELQSGPDEEAVKEFLKSNDFKNALHHCLLSPPFGNCDQDLKNRSTLLVSSCLHSFPPSEIESFLESMTIEEADITMKYIYNAMKLNPDAAICQSLLLWHGRLVDKFGHGAIIRTLSGRQRL